VRVTVDTKRCIGAGQCVLTAPDIFDQDDEGTVVLLVDSPEADEVELVREAVYLCPATAISVSDG
jgi:ferredoxin